MFSLSRLMKTAATRLRSSASAVSFSTIEARVTSSRRGLDRQVGRPPVPHVGQHPVALALHAVEDVLSRIAAA